MTVNQHDVAVALRSGGGVIARRQHPDLIGTLDWMLRRNRLVQIFPGIYTTPDQQGTRVVRLRGAVLWEPNLVFTGATAAQLSFWPELRTATITAALPGARRHPPGFELCRRRVPPELVVERNGLRLTAPALTALDLSEEFGGDGIDTALRVRQTTLALLHEALALTGGRSGNRQRRILLLESRDEPWSRAEREGHKLLHAEGITGWKANFPFRARGTTFYLDLAFPGQRLAVEIDGREYHSDREVFEADRWRQNQLMLAGWRILRFTWDMIIHHPHLVLAQLGEALAA